MEEKDWGELVLPEVFERKTSEHSDVFDLPTSEGALQEQAVLLAWFTEQKAKRAEKLENVTQQTKQLPVVKDVLTKVQDATKMPLDTNLKNNVKLKIRDRKGCIIHKEYNQLERIATICADLQMHPDDVLMLGTLLLEKHEDKTLHHYGITRPSVLHVKSR
jgi:cell fate (sporulation/competence/biofilm development) regulator YmcA (YheA/YmcA/DUF963 family)